jgi:hypothetical protein
MGLYNENKNGIWKGRGYFYEILQQKQLLDTIVYIEVTQSGLFIFDNQNEKKRQLIKEFNLVNQIIICD